LFLGSSIHRTPAYPSAGLDSSHVMSWSAGSVSRCRHTKLRIFIPASVSIWQSRHSITASS